MTFMKNLNTLFFLLLCVFSMQVQAQDQEFLDPIYDAADPVLDITYGVNATVLALAQAGEAIPEALKMDFYSPDNSSEARPTVIYLHTGNFLPQPAFCNLYGTRNDPMIIEFKDRLVARGYNVAIMDYRLGWNPLAATPPDRTAGLINAAYRGVQDLRNVLRFFRDDAANANTYKVDTDKMVAWGDGTGGYVVYAAHAIDNYPQLVLPKFSVDTPLGPVPMVIESINGNPDGTAVGIVTEPFDAFLPFPLGDTLNYVNFPDYDSDFALGVAMGGAVGDISWVTEDDVPLISYHVPNDSLAPYSAFTLTVPTNCELVVEVQGGYLVQEKLNELGVNDVFKLENGDEFRPPYNTYTCLLYTSPSPRDRTRSRMPSSA